MANKIPKVGDAAIMRGRSFKIASIMKRNDVQVVTLHDEEQQAIETAKREDADGLPRGTKWHIRVKLLSWIGAVKAWTVPGMMEPLSQEKIDRAEAEKKAAFIAAAEKAGLVVVAEEVTD